MRTATLFLLMMFGVGAKAECYYSNYALTLQVTTTDSAERTYYRTVSACYFNLDSIQSKAFLDDVLFNASLDNSLAWYRVRAAYRFCIADTVACAEEEKATLYHLFDGVELDRATVRDIRVVAHERVSALDYFTTGLQPSDTALFHQEPIAIIPCGGYLCYHRIAVYANSPALEAVVPAIRTINAELTELEDGLDSSNGDAYDERMWQLIDRIRTTKGLIIVSGCTD